MSPPRRPLVAAVALAVAAGCGKPPPPKQGRIHGTITLDGKPLSKGNVRFIALEASGRTSWPR
jgi:hypothetical protein